MFFYTPTALIYLTRNGFTLFSRQTPHGAEFAVPHTIINDLEVVQTDALGAQFASFAAKHQLRGEKAAILLSDDVLFAKSMPAGTAEEQASAVREFCAEVPFDPKELVHREVSDATGVTVIATNRVLYEVIRDLFAGIGWKVKIVFPVSALPQRFSKKTWQTALPLLTGRARPNFLRSGDMRGAKAGAVPDVALSHMRLWAILSGVALLGTAAAAVYIYLR
jgi:hypothetical protein